MSSTQKDLEIAGYPSRIPQQGSSSAIPYPNKERASLSSQRHKNVKSGMRAPSYSRYNKDIPYRGETPELTSVYLKELLQRYLCVVSEKSALKPDLVLKTWSQVVGPQIAAMTKATRFDQGSLYVAVKNSTLLSILSSGPDKKRLLREISLRLPGVQVQDIVFRFG